MAANKVEEATTVDLGDLLDAGDGAMVTLVAGDTQLAAHKAVLATRSPVFEAMFNHDTLETNSGEVRITDIEGPALRQLVAYMYTLEAPHLPSVAPQLLAAADKYSLSALKAACEQQLAAQLATENAAATAVLAVRHSCPSLTAAAITFIKANLQVMATYGWADAMRNQTEELLEVSRLLADPPAQTRTPATAEGGTTPGTHRRPHSSHGHQTPAACAPRRAAHRTAPPDEASVSRFRVRFEGGTTPGTHRRPHSSHGHQTPAAGAPRRAAHRTAPPDEASVSRFRGVSAKEKGRRLLQAAEEGDVAELQALLAAGADVAARNDSLDTALHRAAWKGHADAASCLVAAGAAVDAGNDIEETPLNMAAQKGHVAVVEVLLAASADPNATDEDRFTPLHYAACCGHADVAAALLRAGADRGARTSCGYTPLDIARLRKQQRLIQILT